MLATGTVIIPTYNRSHLLALTLDSLAAQDLPGERFDVIVVDDGSSDDTRSVADRYREKLRLSYHFQPDEGYRGARARNVGIEHATGDVCIFIDDGVLLHSGAVAAHLAAHEREQATAVIGYVYGFALDDAGADEIRAAADGVDADTAIARLAQSGRCLDFREEFYGKYTDDFADLPAPWPVYWTCNVSAGTEQLRRVGGFDEELQSWGGEDVDLGYRLHRDGARFVLERGAASLHYPHPKSKGANMWSSYVNYRRIAEKYNTPIMQLLLPLPTINPFNMNDVIRLLDLPSCAEFEKATPGGLFGDD
ncbi:glycosyltransferase [Kineosporia sp. NBRC 101731]|uniref:glycosyltransferase n=1 Tax=Kineosporia sp. NBRC 101731 TaxID=3032199 RepID=UPI0024A38B59|nr:glycosyltransferase [Kineosporia sp. NBRC 101731]GLY29546.1 glycosyl transferase [Kineosporia sp. NBRC 101731]